MLRKYKARINVTSKQKMRKKPELRPSKYNLKSKEKANSRNQSENTNISGDSLK